MRAGLPRALIPTLAAVRGIAALALAGSRTKGTATASSDDDIGLYTGPDFHPKALQKPIAPLCDAAASLTPVGAWGLWINARFLITEKGALDEAASCPRTIPDLVPRANAVWHLIGTGQEPQALTDLRALHSDLKALLPC